MKREGFALLVLVVLLALPTVVWADGVCPCPENTLSITKCEWDEDTGAYICDEGDGDAIAFGDGTNADGGTWVSTVEIATVVIKGATGCHTYTYDPAATGGSFSNEVLEPNPSGEPPDISSVEFCKPKPTAVALTTFDARVAQSTEWPFGTPWPWLVLGLGIMAAGSGLVLVVLRRKGELN